MEVFHFRTASKRTQESGQAILETILILVITVSIILGVITQFNTAFRVWANNYFGDYLSCLLETGELPTLGDTSGRTAGICDQLYSDFSLANGTSPIDPGGGGSGGGGDGSGDGADGQGGSPSAGLNETSTAGSGSSTRVSSRSGAGSGGDFGGGGSRGQEGGGGAARARAPAYTGSTESSIPGSLLVSSDQNDREDSREELIEGYRTSVAEQEEEERREAGLVKPIEGNEQKKTDRFLVEKRGLASVQEEPDVEMGFGNYLRFLLIAAIVIALVVFFGGQAIQISKSMD